MISSASIAKLSNLQAFKKFNGINTEVWIGPKKLNENVTAYYEWHFLAPDWNDTDLINQRYQIPISLEIFATVNLPGSSFSAETSKLFQIINFRTDYDVHVNDFDLTKCGNILKQDFFIFSLPSDPKTVENVKHNLRSFKQHVVKTLAEKAKVTVLRVSNIEVHFQADTVFVLFTLFERSIFYGDVKTPENDEISPRAIRNIRDAFSKNEIEIEFHSSGTRGRIKVKVDPDSLKNIDNYEILYTSNKGTSKAVTALLTIFFATIGLIIGVFVTILEKRKKIQYLKMFY